MAARRRNIKDDQAGMLCHEQASAPMLFSCDGWARPLPAAIGTRSAEPGPRSLASPQLERALEGGALRPAVLPEID
jgi:hypothetical protein